MDIVAIVAKRKIPKEQYGCVKQITMFLLSKLQLWSACHGALWDCFFWFSTNFEKPVEGKPSEPTCADPLLRSEGRSDPGAVSTPGALASATVALASVPLATNGSDFVGSVVGVAPRGSMKMVPSKKGLGCGDRWFTFDGNRPSSWFFGPENWEIKREENSSRSLVVDVFCPFNYKNENHTTGMSLRLLFQILI